MESVLLFESIDEAWQGWTALEKVVDKGHPMKRPENTFLADIHEVTLSFVSAAHPEHTAQKHRVPMFHLAFGEQVAEILMYVSRAHVFLTMPDRAIAQGSAVVIVTTARAAFY